MSDVKASILVMEDGSFGVQVHQHNGDRFLVGWLGMSTADARQLVEQLQLQIVVADEYTRRHQAAQEAAQ
jgi:hypothetical protein